MTGLTPSAWRDLRAPVRQERVLGCSRTTITTYHCFAMSISFSLLTTTIKRQLLCTARDLEAFSILIDVFCLNDAQLEREV